MNIYMGAYQKSLIENEKQTQIWSDYLKDVRDLDFSVFKDKLKVPALIPIGSRLSLRGELVHTNEVTVGLGADYFVKCTVKQAEIIMQHRIKVAEDKLKSLEKEREYLQEHLAFTNESVLKELGKDIMEDYNENEEKEWREKHKENLRRHKMEEKLARETNNISDDDIWEKLEKLELIEELEEHEIKDQESSLIEKLKKHSNSKLKSETNLDKTLADNKISDLNNISSKSIKPELDDADNLKKGIKNVHSDINEKNIFEDVEYTTSKDVNSDTNYKSNMTDDVTEKTNMQGRVKELKKRLAEIKSKKTTLSTSEDVFRCLEYLEEQEMLEEELDRLEDECLTSDEETDIVEETESKQPKKSISFASDCESDCLEINFKHSDINIEHTTYNKEAGILKPSDIYYAFPENFVNTSIASILKKTKYGENYEEKECGKSNKSDDMEIPIPQNTFRNVIGDVHENYNENKVITSERPISKFKAMRMHKT